MRYDVPPFFGGFITASAMEPITRSLSTQESKVVLALTERGRRVATRAEIPSVQIQGRPLGLALCFCIHADESVEVEGREEQEQIVAAKIRKIGGKKRWVAALYERSPLLVEGADLSFPPMGPCCEIQFISRASVSTSTSLCKEIHFLR